MEIEQQIEALKEAKNRVRNHMIGICRAIKYILFHRYRILISERNPLSSIIPIFTYKNACKFDETVKKTNKKGYWWDIRDRESRCKFIDWMISELEKQLKNEEDENI